MVGLVRRLLCDHSHLVEIRDRICRGPETDLARLLECLICGLDFLHAVMVTNKLVAHGFHAGIRRKSL